MGAGQGRQTEGQPTEWDSPHLCRPTVGNSCPRTPRKAVRSLTPFLLQGGGGRFARGWGGTHRGAGVEADGGGAERTVGGRVKGLKEAKRPPNAKYIESADLKYIYLAGTD